MTATVYLLLQRTAGAYTNYLKTSRLEVSWYAVGSADKSRGMPSALPTSLEVYICCSIQLRHHYVDVVAAHARAEGRHAGTVVAARHRMQLSVAALMLDAVEDAFEHVDALGVADKQHLVGQGAGCQVYVIEATVGGQW